MNTNNRILIAYHNEFWRVWEGSCDVNYFEPPENEIAFDTYEEADHYAQQKAQGMLNLEGGVQILTPEEVLEGLLEEQKKIHERIEKTLYQIRENKNGKRRY